MRKRGLSHLMERLICGNSPLPLVEDCSIYVDEEGKNLVSIYSYFVLKIVDLIVAVTPL